MRCIGLLGALSLVWSTLSLADVRDRDDIRAYIEELTTEHGFSAAELESLFAQVEIRDDIIEKISRPAERVWTWSRYKSHLVDQARVDAGVEFGRQHQVTLERAHTEYGVAPEVVLAVLGIETRFGRITGSYGVVEALTTLGFAYPPRSKFFKKELTEFLILAREEGKDPLSLQGSYAGAMGYGQFIPSSYRYYSVDFDGDGLRDIWANPVDAIGSIANYFARHRWSGDQPPAVPVTVTPDSILSFDTGLDLNHTVAQLRDQGVVLPAGVELAGDLKARIYRVEGEAGVEHWLALHDFYVITRYNRSHLYALAVHHLAQAIKAQL